MLLAGTQVIAARTGVVEPAPVRVLFWSASLMAVLAMATGMPLDTPQVTVALAILTLLGGLPHGAFDLALAARAWRLSARSCMMLGLGYVAVAAAMILAWLLTPGFALIVFLVIAAIHFGEDWTMLDSGLLRFMAGFAVIAAATLGQTAAVSGLFDLLAPGEGTAVARSILVIAPLALLVTAVGLLIAWQDGHRHWAMAHATALACLGVLPPMTGFFLYFVLLHSPRHLTSLRNTLSEWSPLRLWRYGAIMTGACLVLAGWLGPGFWSGDPSGFAAEGFRVLSIVAAPHLVLSSLLERTLGRHRDHKPAACERC